jgi:hypothetical protein
VVLALGAACSASAAARPAGGRSAARERRAVAVIRSTQRERRARPARPPRALKRGVGAPAQPLLVSDVGSLSSDERLLFTALQGIANRTGPHVYLLGLDDTSATWLRLAVPLATEHVAPYELLARLRSTVRGLVVWDPNLPTDTQNVATTWAGLENLLPASPELAARLSKPPYTLPVLHDLRDEHFSSRAAAYDWALSHLGPPSRFGLLAWIGGPSSGPRHGIRDLVVARRGFAFQANPESDASTVQKILGAFPALTAVYGYPCLDDQISGQSGVPACEPAGVGEISRAGKFLVPTDLAANLSVDSWFRPLAEHPPWSSSPAPLDPTKTYVTFVISDGDNVGANEEWLLEHQWADPARGTIPMGISISPRLSLLAPRIYDYFVHTLTPNDVLVAGPSGAGYVYPGLDPDLSGYLDQTRRLMALSGLRAVWILDNGYAYSPSPQTVQSYVEALHPPAIFTDYFGATFPNPPATYLSEGVPVIHAVWGPDVTTTTWRVEGAAYTYPTRPAFVFVALNTWTMGFTQARQVMQALGPSYEVVRPDRFAAMLQRAGGVAVPAVP